MPHPALLALRARRRLGAVLLPLAALAALLPLGSADAQPARSAPADVEAVSLLGDTLRRPALDAAARARFEALRVAALALLAAGWLALGTFLFLGFGHVLDGVIH